MNDLNILPNLLVVFGSESRVIKPYLHEFAQRNSVIRIYNQNRPEPLNNCVDISGIESLATELERIQGRDQARIVLLGVAAKSQQHLFSQLDRAARYELLQTNVFSYVELISVLMPFMIRARYGRLVYLSSIRARHIARGASLYGASKAFCEHLFSSIGSEYGRLNITSCSIRMGFFEGRMSTELSRALLDESLTKVALSRLGTGKELKRAIDFAVANPYTNGGILSLDGGYSCG